MFSPTDLAANLTQSDNKISHVRFRLFLFLVIFIRHIGRQFYFTRWCNDALECVGKNEQNSQQN